MDTNKPRQGVNGWWYWRRAEGELGWKIINRAVNGINIHEGNKP